MVVVVFCCCHLSVLGAHIVSAGECTLWLHDRNAHHMLQSNRLLNFYGSSGVRTSCTRGFRMDD